MTSPLRRTILWGLATLATWAALAGTAFALMHDLEKEVNYWLVVAIAPSIAIVCGQWSVRLSSPFARPIRVLFWLLTFPGVLAIAYFCHDQWGSLSGGFWSDLLSGRTSALLLTSAIIPVLSAVGLLYRGWRSPASSIGHWSSKFCDMATGFATAVIVAAGALCVFNYHASQVEREGLKRWAALGEQGLKEFQKPIEENASYQALLADFRPYGMNSLYKQGTAKYMIGPANDTVHTAKPEFDYKEVCDLLEFTSQKGDEIAIPPGKAPHLAARADELSALYRSILSRPAPVWECHPANGIERMGMPNYLFLRKLAQTVCADALLRLAKGDTEGAEAAVATGLRVTDSMRDSPILVSVMVRVAIEALLAQVSAHLPVEADGWEQLAKDADSTRANVKRVCASETFILLTEIETGPKPNLPHITDPTSSNTKSSELWRKFRYLLVGRPSMRLEIGRGLICTAGIIDQWNHLNLLTAKNDLGEAEAQSLFARYPCVMMPNLPRVWARANTMLALREQAQVIRFARAQMAAGKLESPSEHPSVVIPGAKWEITPDRPNNSVTLKLKPTPAWLINSPVTNDRFFLLPFDGSKPWKFATR